jgi:hypothetical protein
MNKTEFAVQQVIKHKFTVYNQYKYVKKPSYN